MTEIKKVLNIYGNRGWNNKDWKYCNKSMLRGYAALSAYLEKLQMLNKNMNVYSTSFSLFDLNDDKIIFLHVLYSGEIDDILNGEFDDGTALYNGTENELRDYVDINKYDKNGYNRLVRISP